MSTHNTSIEIEIDGEWIEFEFEIEFSASAFVPARLHGHPDTWCPAEGGEIEVTDVHCVTTHVHFDADDFVFMQNWSRSVDGRKPTYSTAELHEECFENIDPDEGFDPPDSGYDDYRDREADDYY